MASSNPSIALWATNVARPVAGIDDWLSVVDGKLAEAGEAGAGMLVMPEYASAQWLTYKPADLATTGEVAWMAAEGERAMAALPDLVRRRGVSLLAGTMPAADGVGGYVNRAHLLIEDGRVAVQDKLCLTPGEKSPQGWMLSAGSRLTVIEWRGLKLAVVICLDVELPALAAAITGLDLDLILVPSMTARPSGYHRVFGCARARAIELMALVAAVGTVGTVNGETNYSGAALFGPCEAAMGDDGMLAAIEPMGGHTGDGQMLIVSDLPVDTVRLLRAGAAEVWPGPWQADGVTIATA